MMVHAKPSPVAGSNEYRCASCGETFEKGRSDDEAKEELSNTFPGWDEDDCDLVCDDCWKKMGYG